MIMSALLLTQKKKKKPTRQFFLVLFASRTKKINKKPSYKQAEPNLSRSFLDSCNHHKPGMSYMSVIVTGHHNVLKEKDIHQRQIYLTIDNQDTWNADGNTDIAQASQSKVVHTTPAANPFQLNSSWWKATTTGHQSKRRFNESKKDNSHLPLTNLPNHSSPSHLRQTHPSLPNRRGR